MKKNKNIAVVGGKGNLFNAVTMKLIREYRQFKMPILVIDFNESDSEDLRKNLGDYVKTEYLEKELFASTFNSAETLYCKVNTEKSGYLEKFYSDFYNLFEASIKTNKNLLIITNEVLNDSFIGAIRSFNSQLVVCLNEKNYAEASEVTKANLIPIRIDKNLQPLKFEMLIAEYYNKFNTKGFKVLQGFVTSIVLAILLFNIAGEVLSYSADTITEYAKEDKDYEIKKEEYKNLALFMEAVNAYKTSGVTYETSTNAKIKELTSLIEKSLTDGVVKTSEYNQIKDFGRRNMEELEPIYHKTRNIDKDNLIFQIKKYSDLQEKR